MKVVHGDVHTCLRSSTSSEVFPGLFKFGFRPRFFHGLCIILVRKFPECLLLALALLQYCCVVKRDVS